MSKVSERMLRATIRPQHVILIIVAVTVGLTGIYVIGPWYVGGPTTAIGASLESAVARAVLGLAYIIPSVMSIIGVVKDREHLRYLGAFGLFLSLCFITVLRLLSFGFIPVIWVFSLALALISGTLALKEGAKS